MFSKAGIGALLTVAVTILNLFGVDLPEGTVGNATEAIATIVGIVMLVWGQFDRPDLKYGLIRKN